MRGGIEATAAPPSPLAGKAQVEAFLRQFPLPPRYRHAQTYLFQGVPLREIPSRLPQGRPFAWDIFGPTHLYVDALSGWAWSRPGGDWIDARGVRHGPQPWFVMPADAVRGADQSASYEVDVTRLVAHVQSADRWLAVLLSAPGAPRVLAGMASGRAPVIDVTHDDGS
ncbi:MAG TPA: hypothetical protein PK306_26165, partial [Aquabacterium sp.]|nr:hypothetical protein [Aquabacterium sp.]